MTTPPGPAQPAIPRNLAIRRLAAVTLMFATLAAALVLPSGRLDWWEAWLFLGVYYLVAVASMVEMLHRDPALAAERGRLRPEARRWDQIIVALNSLLTVGLYVVIGLDAGRYGWSHVPIAVRLFALLGLLPAFGLPTWASRTNTYLAGLVSIQEDRGHQAVTQGPYRFVRHPMYLGMIFYDLCVPLLLGSWWGLLVGAAMIVLVLVRTALEDRTLRAGLPGYKAYAERVRFRLIPGVW
jgi:protein-S-isoprenylcysteine O-methyltransferase Ste14